MTENAPQRPEQAGAAWQGVDPGPAAPPDQPGWSSPLSAPAGWGGPVPQPPGRRPGDRRSVVALRPLGLGELLDGAVAVVRGFPRPVFAAGAAVAVVGAGLQLLVTLTLLRPLLQLHPVTVTDLQNSAGELTGAGVGAGVTVMFATFSALLLAGLVAPAVSRGLLGRTLTPAEAWDQLRPRLGALAGVSLVVTLAVFALPSLAIGLTVLLIVVGGNSAGLLGLLLVPAGLGLSVLLYVRWAFAPVCVVLERQSVGSALRRSALLVSRSWWRVLGILILSSIIAGVVGQILQLPFSALGGGSGLFSSTDTSTPGLIAAAAGSMVAATIVGPFLAGVRGLLYADRRMRAEGLDVALAAAVAAPVPGGP